MCLRVSVGIRNGILSKPLQDLSDTGEERRVLSSNTSGRKKRIFALILYQKVCESVADRLTELTIVLPVTEVGDYSIMEPLHRTDCIDPLDLRQLTHY